MGIPSRTPAPAARPAWLTHERFPFESRFTDVGGTLVHYIDEGSGPAFLLVSAGFWTFMFRDLVLRLQGDFRCIALDFPGSGLSGAPDDASDQGLVANAAVLERFIRVLDLQDLTMLVHDVGGPTGLLVAGRHPEWFRALVVTNTFAWPLRDYPLVRVMLRLVGSRPFRALNSTLNLVARVTASPHGVGRRFDRTDRALFERPWRSRTARRTSQVVLAQAGRADAVLADLERRLPAALGSLPVLTLFGRLNDRFGWQDRFGRMLENVTATSIEDGNHFPFCDDPDRFGAEILNWWRGVVCAGANER